MMGVQSGPFTAASTEDTAECSEWPQRHLTGLGCEDQRDLRSQLHVYPLHIYL